MSFVLETACTDRQNPRPDMPNSFLLLFNQLRNKLQKAYYNYKLVSY